MGSPLSNGKIVVFGIDNQFGEEVVAGLASDGHSLVLCGDNSVRHQKLTSRYGKSVKGFCDQGQADYRKQVQVQIESLGSLDAAVFLINPSRRCGFFQLADSEITDTFTRNFIHPVLMLKSIFPYLKKNKHCKVIFIDTSAFMPSLAVTDQEIELTVGAGIELQSASSSAIEAFCQSVQAEMAEKGVDVRAITNPAQLTIKTQSPKDDSYMAYGSEMANKIQQVMRSSERYSGMGASTESPLIARTFH